MSSTVLVSPSPTATPKPISVSTSQAWDSDGAGLWSTFVVAIGNPAQVSRVIVSTAGDETWVILSQGCPSSYGADCANDRGDIFNADNSTSWVNIGEFELDLELNLGYTGNGKFGYDTITLGYPNSGGTQLQKQIVAGLATPDFWLGQFGLDPTTRYNKVQGSLTLGGYDASRIGSKNVTFGFYNDISRRFIADLTAITYIPSGVSTVTTSTTLLSETLSITNPSITFTLANTAGQILDIISPYSAFDLKASFPVIPDSVNSTNYFPLKRATNDTEYTLGRVFLQETFLIADYDRSEFIIAPCFWPSTFTDDIIAIYPPSNTNTTVTTTQHKSKSKPIGTIVGGVVGGVILIFATLLAYWWFVYKPKQKRTEIGERTSEPGYPPGDTIIGPEAGTTAEGINVTNKPELDANVQRIELPSPNEEEWKDPRPLSEMAATPVLAYRHEIDGQMESRSELGVQRVFEMPAREPV